MPVTGDKPGVNRTTFRPPWVKEPGTAASPSQIARKSITGESTGMKTAPAWAKKPVETPAPPVTEIKLKSTLVKKKSVDQLNENGAKDAIKNVKLTPVTQKQNETGAEKSILKSVLKPVGATDRRTSMTQKKEEESELEKKFKLEKPKLRPVMSVKKTESFSKKAGDLEKSKSGTKTVPAPTPTKTPTKTTTTTAPSKPVATPTKTAVKTTVKAKPKVKTPTPPSSSDEEEESEEEEEEEEEETEEEEEETEEEDEEESEEESEEEQPVKKSSFAQKKSPSQNKTQQNNNDDDEEEGDGRRPSRVKFEKPKLRHVVINKQKSFNKSIDEFEKIRPVLKKTPRVDESKPSKGEGEKPEFVDVELKPVPPKSADADEHKSIVPPPPPPPPPSSGIPPPPPPPPLAPPTEFEKKDLSEKQRKTLEKLKSRPRKRPDWSDMMAEVEKGRKLKHVQCNDRSKPILALSKSVTKVDGQFVFETEKANVHNVLLKQIQSGVRLKPTKCNDRSKPVLEGLRKFRRQMTIEEQIQKSESKANLNQADIPDEVLEDSPDEMDDIDKLRDDLQSTKQMLALELRNKEAQERENKRLLAKIANLEAELANEKTNGSAGAGGGDKSGKVDDKLVQQFKKDAEEARKETKVIEKKYNDTAEQLDVAKGHVEEQRRKIADLEKKLMQAVQGIIPSSSSSRRQSTAVGKESSPELELDESESGEDETEEQKEARKARRLEREVKFLRQKLIKLLDKEMAAKKEKANIKEAMKKNQTFLKQETKKLKKLEKEVAKMAATMTLDEDDEENGHEDKEEPEDEEEEETETEESESESEEEETESESEESEDEDAPNEQKKANLEPRVKKHEGRLTALKKTNFLLQTNVDRLQDEINLTREKAGSLQAELDAVVADFGF